MAETKTTVRESPGKILTVAVLISLVCSVFVASAAVLLKPRQEANERLNMQRNILEVAGLFDGQQSIGELFARVETRIIDLETGAYVDDVDPAEFDELRAAKDPELGLDIPPELDVAGIGSRSRYAKVYFAPGSGDERTLILPVRGYGLWSTMYGFVALGADGNTVQALSFYDHAETPGLGDQIENPAWLASWRGKRVYDDTGDLRIRVIKGRVQPEGSAAVHQVDGLSGATLTGNGVTNLMQYWLGEHGYGPYLSRLRSSGS